MRPKWLRSIFAAVAIAVAVAQPLGLVSMANAQSRTPEEQAANARYHQMDVGYQNANRPPASGAPNTPPAQGAQTCPLSAEQTQKAMTAFRALKPVMQHPRCINCHGVYGDLFENPRTAHPGGHIPLDRFENPTIPCGNCHEEAGNVWELAPGKMFFTNKNDTDLCFRLKQKGSGINLLNHFAEDPRILLAFQGKRGQNVPAAPPPISHDEFLKRAEAWVAAVYGTTSQQTWDKEYPGSFDSKCGCEVQENPDAQVARVVAALTSLPQCPGMQLGPTCFQKFNVSKSGLAVTAFLAREPAAGSERTDVRATAWLDQATADRNFKSSLDAFRAKKMSPTSAFESFAATGQADSGALEVWLNSNFGGESREAGQAFGVLICGKVVGHLKMFISAGFKGASGEALVDATRTQMKGLLQQIGSALLASGACAT